MRINNKVGCGGSILGFVEKEKKKKVRDGKEKKTNEDYSSPGKSGLVTSRSKRIHILFGGLA